jgi:uncharacterized membrane protein
MDNEIVETNSVGNIISIVLAIIVILALLVFVFLAGGWYTKSNQKDFISPVPSIQQ